MNEGARFARHTVSLLALLVPLAAGVALLAPRSAVPLAAAAPAGASAVAVASLEPLPGPSPVASPASEAIIEHAVTSAPVPAAWAPPPALRLDSPPPPPIAGVAWLLLDDASGAVLYHEAGHTPLPPASLTKIATAIVAIEASADLDAWVTVDVDSRTMRGSTVMGLVPGDQFTVRDLLYGMMLPSGNDAALALGRHVAGSDAAFVARMNELAVRLGLRETQFRNPHGLNAAGHQASAHDLALLMRYAMTLPAFREVAGTQVWAASGARALTFYNVAGGSLLRIPGADAVKSGFTRQAGRTLAVTAEREGHRLYAVVLNNPQRETDAGRLLDWGFRAYEWGR